MTIYRNGPGSGLFAVAAQDWSAGAFADRVLYLPISSDPEFTRQCSSVLSDVESQRADCFVTDHGRSHFIQRRAFRRYCAALASRSVDDLSQIDFEETDNGQPWLPDRPDLQFSFSSCRLGFMGAWSASNAIGVDIEDPSINVEAAQLAETYFSAAEARAIARKQSVSDQKFLQLWCLKEAALKSIGEGLPFGLDSFEFDLDEGLRIVRAPKEHGGPQQFDALLYERIGICAAIVVRKPRNTDN